MDPITLTAIIGGLLTLAPAILPALLGLVTDFFKSAQQKETEERAAVAAATEAEKKRQMETGLGIAAVVGVVLVLVAGVGAFVYYKRAA